MTGKIHSFETFGSVDGPGVRFLVFLSGCNFRCKYCHNPDTWTRPAALEMSADEVLAKALRYREYWGADGGITVSGGEPLLQKDIDSFLEKLRAMGYRIKLDTNGTHPERLRELMEKKLVDYVAMDIKNSPARYAQTAGLKSMDLSSVRESVSLLLTGKADYEFRTTVLAELHDEESFREIGKWIRGAKRYFLQPFVDRDSVPFGGLHAPSREALIGFLEIVKPYVEQAEIRGMD